MACLVFRVLHASSFCLPYNNPGSVHANLSKVSTTTTTMVTDSRHDGRGEIQMGDFLIHRSISTSPADESNSRKTTPCWPAAPCLLCTLPHNFLKVLKPQAQLFMGHFLVKESLGDLMPSMNWPIHKCQGWAGGKKAGTPMTPTKHQSRISASLKPAHRQFLSESACGCQYGFFGIFLPAGDEDEGFAPISLQSILCSRCHLSWISVQWCEFQK